MSEEKSPVMVRSSLLSSSEVRFINALVRGDTRKDIALDTGLKINQVAATQVRILKKLEAKTALHAITILFRRGELS